MAAETIRLKSRWFKAGAVRTPEQQAGAMGFALWRIARRVLERMRAAGFEIDAGGPYFAFLAEMLVFLAVVADRLAHQRLDSAGRAAFTTALVRHLAATFDDNALDLLGEPGAGDRFIDLYNERVDLYAEFGAAPGAVEFSPGLAMLRVLGGAIEPTLPQKDRLWVLDQLVAIQIPDAAALLQRTMRELHATEPRPARRASPSGD